METYYIIVSKEEYGYLKQNGYLKTVYDDFIDEEKRMSVWMLAQMQIHLPYEAFNTSDEKNDFIFMFLNLDDICMEMRKDYIVLEIKKNPKHVVLFDDNDYVTVANNIMNNQAVTYLARSEDEAKEYETASETVIKASWDSMFDLTLPRDISYCGSFSLRGATPYVSYDMVIRKI
jgi:hypothetical protein